MKRRLRIAVWHNLPSGGGKRALYNQIKGLVSRGHTVEAWCPPTAEQSYLSLANLIPERVVALSSHIREPAGPIGRLFWPYRRTIGMLEAMDRHCLECAGAIKLGDFDLLFANSCALFRVPPIARHVKIPTIIYLGEPNRFLYEAMPQLPWLAIPASKRPWSPSHVKSFVFDLLKVQGLRIQAREERTNAAAFDCILVNSLFSRESVLRAYGLDAKLCYLGVDSGQFKRRQRHTQDFVVGIGALVRQKNIEFAIAAMGRLPEPRPELVWIGDHADEVYLEELYRQAKTAGIRFTPKVGIGDPELLDLLGSALLMVYAPRLEPFGLAVLEAGACGLPVVAVAEGGVRETVIDGVNGLLVEPDVASMATAIARLMLDPHYASQLGATGAALVAQRWSLDASVDRLEARFLELIERAATETRHSNMSPNCDTLVS